MPQRGKEAQMAKKKEKDTQPDLLGSAHRIWLAGLGAVALAEEEGSKVFKGLVERGENVEAKGKEHVEKARGAMSGVKTVAESYWETFGRVLDDKMTAVIHRLGVPTKEEIDALMKKVDNLNATIEKIRSAPKAPAKKTKSPTRKSTTDKKTT
jgi:poly(hydroxyalkanoate) granule-associated protein